MQVLRECNAPSTCVIHTKGCKMFTREEIEKLLDDGKLEVKMRTGSWWKVRRNGQTKTWKTRPSEFRIPIKMGLFNHGYISDQNMNSEFLRQVVEDKPVLPMSQRLR